MCPSHGDAYAPSSRAQPASVDTTTSRPVAARLPCRLHPRGRVRTRCAPPAAPPRPDHTHVRLSRGRGSRPGKAAEPVQCPPPPLTPGWSSVTQGSARPYPTHRPPYPPPQPRLTPMAKGNTHVIRGTCWTQCLLPSRRAGRERGEGREQCVADSHVRLARWLPVGRVGRTRRQKSGAHSRSPLRRVPPRPAPPPFAPRCTYLINVGAQKVLGRPKQWGYPNPKVNEEGKKKT